MNARLLVIEDDDRVARLVARMLAKDGHLVDRAATGPEGLSRALREDFDLVVLDLMLPGMGGLELLRRLMGERPHQTVLVLSALPQVGTRVDCLEAGAADFVAKPFSLAELRARVRARLREHQPADHLTVAEIDLDLHAHRAKVAGHTVLLSDREFALLQYLMRRVGQVCSRVELLREVWDIGFDPGSNIVDVYIRRLRAKLDHPERIETVRHVGYRFHAA